jgi:CoA:oxalate CoA-transferase
MARLGLDYETVKSRNPSIIYASLSGFGQTGPAAGRGANDIIIQGMAGIMSITGHPDGPPARPGYSIGDLAGGLFFAQGVLAAIVERQRSGQGQYLDVSMLEAQVNLLENAVIRYFATGELPKRMGTSHQLAVPFQAFTTKDGYIVISRVRNWELLCGLLGCDELVGDERYATNRSRLEHHAELEPILNAAFARKTTDEWLALLDDKFLVAPLNTIDRMVKDDQLNARQAFVEVPSWKGRPFTVVNSPIKLSRTPASVTRGADRPGGHTHELLREVLGLDADEIETMIEEGVVGHAAE